MFVRTKSYNGQTYDEGSITLYPHRANSSIGTGKLELGGKVYWISVIPTGGQTKNGKEKFGFMTLREAGRAGPRKKW